MLSGQGEDVKDFTRTRWDTYRACVKKWLPLHGESTAVLAETYKHCVDVDFDNIPEDAGFHASCYIRFIDKKSFSAAEKRVTQTVEERGADADQSMPSDNIAEASTSSEPPRKKLRSRTGLPVPSSGPVLPPLCIICKKVEKLINVAGKRQRDRLSLAETLTAGKPQTHTRTH